MKGREWVIFFVIIVIKITIHLFWIFCQYLKNGCILDMIHNFSQVKEISIRSSSCNCRLGMQLNATQTQLNQKGSKYQLFYQLFTDIMSIYCIWPLLANPIRRSNILAISLGERAIIQLWLPDVMWKIQWV